ncbi:hypothetical protein F3Y22_tig00110403pilonHSYRG00039 [Hibiscus syriacus]|uniref:RRM domain-containing protein n=1 Tax=Hibiscus syriacus TaxID=106335 RepID=A0A6A3AQ80_HIBSY|nr:hypothetical protein F3Y22_tig00110403pilonHSYRG00039 [Hibiscus syriacus]
MDLTSMWNVGIQTLFVQNIPPRYHWSGLRQLFGRHGDVVSSYIARKYDRMGKRFGFVRFSNKDDSVRAMQRLNGFWLFGYRLSVKEARHRAKNLSVNLNSPSNSNIATRVPKDKSSAEEGSETHVSRRSRIIQGVIDEDVVRKLQKCLVGSMTTVCSSIQVEDRLRAGGLGDAKTKFLRGRDFLIEIVDDELYRFMKEHNWSLLREVFLEVHMWTESYRAFERVTWIKLIGVPLHCWNHITFKRIAEQWGEFLALGENALQELGCEEMIILIATSRKDLIDEVVDLEAGRDVFKVRIVEQSTNRSESSSRKQEAKANLATVESSSSIGRRDFLSDVDEEERNIGEDAILGQRVNAVGSGEIQKQLSVMEEHEGEVAQNDSRILIKVVDANDGINDILKDLSLWEGSLGSKAVEDTDFMGLTNSLPKKGSNGIVNQLDGSLVEPKGSKPSLGREGEAREQGLCMLTKSSDDVFMPKHKQNDKTRFQYLDSVISDRFILIEGKHATDVSIFSVMNVYAPGGVSEQVSVFIESCWCCKAVLIVESDSKVVLAWIQNASTCPWRRGVIFQEIDVIALMISEIKFVFSPRTTNNMEDYLAMMGSTGKVMFMASW